MSVLSGLVVHIPFSQVFFHFPTPRYTRFAKWMMVAQYTISGLGTIFFMHATLSRDTYYLFAGHNWDFDSDDLSRMVGALILLNIVILLISGIVHLVLRKEHRLPVGGLLTGFFLAVGPTSVANILSRDGLLARDIYQTILILAAISGYFVALVVYFNHAREKTSFMLKIMGVSLVTFMLVMAFVCFFAFQDKEDAYDSVKAELASHLAGDSTYDALDLDYLIAFDRAKKSIRVLRPTADMTEDTFSEGTMDMVNTSAYERIRRLRPEAWKKDLPAVLDGNPPEFSGYRALLMDLSQRVESPRELLAAVDALSTTLRYRALKVKELPDKTFRVSLSKYLLSLPPALKPLAGALQAFLDQNQGMEGRELKHHAVAFFTPFRPEGERHYRSGANSHHYTAFLKVDARHDVVYEAGFSYLAYRKFVQKTGTKLMLIFIAIVAVVVLGFRLFFLGALVRPLESLLEGVRKVNKGDLEVEVAVSLPDEIGF
ncbi:MAG: HAMP domain-containing protein, partial [Spirochaetia bacterium]|nr:HAMP domain-containing protein [Spirochaetia bacterium]